MSSTPPGIADDSTGVVDRVKAWREGVRRHRTLNLVYRSIVTIVGFAVVVLGLLLLPLPGPGWLIVFLGLGILATEYEWSRRLLQFAREKVRAWTEWLKRQSIVVKALVGLATLAIVLGAIWLFLWFSGVPTWIPDWVPIVHDIPQR